MPRLARLTRSMVVLLLGLVACRDGTAPEPGQPARLLIVSGASFSGPVATVLETPLAVRVVDQRGRAVMGAVVKFALLRGGGSLDPLSAITGLSGRAQTRLTLGPTAGNYEVAAAVDGVLLPVRFLGVANPGPAARVVVTPGQARLAAVGDSLRLRARQLDGEGNAMAGVTVTWRSADPDVFTIDETGLARAVRGPAIGRAIASVAGRADTAFVVVGNADASRCLGYSPPVTLAVGQAIDVSMTDGACIVSAEGNDEYVIVPWHGSTVGGSTVTLQVTGSGITTVTASPSVGPAAGSVTAARIPAGRDDPVRAFDLEDRIREMGRRDVIPRLRAIRASLGRGAASPDVRVSAIPANLAVGTLVELNANARASCSAPSMRTGRIAAASSRAIIVHDTANPAGGFSDADYQRFATRFDTLVAPVAEAAFGVPTDIDGNGKVVIFFTRAVNELTPPAASFYFGGFFHSRDLLPKQQDGATVCAGSNEAEMFYMLVPDPEGVVNGNRRRVGFVDSVTVGTLAHEYQHLINAARRAYVNDATTDEEIWLNEGLSHIAEELVFYRVTRTTPRQNLGGDRFGTPRYDGAFTEYMAPNVGRFRAFLQNPHSFSPYSPGDGIAARGAAWAFLRYAADRHGPTDGDVWMRLVNSTTAGLQNLRAVFGPNVLGLVRNWTVALYTDDYVTGVPPALTQPSWNFRTIFPALLASAVPYPLVDVVRTLPDELPHSISLRGGSGGFIRFAVMPGREASIRVTSNGVAPPATVRATIVRRQ